MSPSDDSIFQFSTAVDKGLRRGRLPYAITLLLLPLITCFTQAQDCEYCLTFPCQDPIPSANDIVWQNCLPCFQKAHQCQSAGTCAYSFIGQYSDSPNSTLRCCSAARETFLSNVEEFKASSSHNCTAPSFIWTPRNATASTPLPSFSSNQQPLQFIMPQMNFSCSGCFQTLNITLKEQVSSNSTFLFQLWRRYIPTGDQTSVVTNELYQLNTSVPLTVIADPLSSSNVHSLPLNVCFREGDIVGIQLPPNSLLKIATDNSSVIYRREIPAQCSDMVSGIFQPSLNFTGSPLITLILATTLSPTPSTVLLTMTSDILKVTQTDMLGAVPTANPCRTADCLIPAEKELLSRPVAIGLGASASCAVAIVMILLSVCVVKLKMRWKPQLASQMGETIVFKNRRRGNTPSFNQKTIESFTSQYQANGEFHVYQELTETSHHTARKKTETQVDHKNVKNVNIVHNNISTLPISQSSAYISAPILSCCSDYSVSHAHAPNGSTHFHGDHRTSVSSIPIEISGQGNTSTSSHHTSSSLPAPNTSPVHPSPSHLYYHDFSSNKNDEKQWLINKLITNREEGVTNTTLPSSEPTPPHEKLQALDGSHEYSCLAHCKGMVVNSQNVSLNDDVFWDPPSSCTELYNVLSKKKYREIHHDGLRILNALGTGNFATVYRGVWSFIGGEMEVAVKKLKDGASEEDKVKFLQEAVIMGQFSHPNVVKMYGVVTTSDPLVMAQELMPRGDLRNFVLFCRPQESSQQPGPNPISTNLPKLFISFARDIACGMAYLSRKNFVHRDLAARNILLTEDLRCKIGDFGMARDLTQSYECIYQSQGGVIPLKWSAPEAIKNRQYNTSSDVWSFGMVLFEVWSLGHKPFENESLNKVADLVTTGYCQPPPPGCPRAMYSLMVLCWNPKAAGRPSFSDLYQQLGKPVEELLAWSPEDRECGEQVSELGAPMTCSRNLYPDLQNSYT